MMSRVVKISFLFVIILFSVCLFNSCYAYGFQKIDMSPNPFTLYYSEEVSHNIHLYGSGYSASASEWVFDSSRYLLNDLVILNKTFSAYSVFEQIVEDYNNGLNLCYIFFDSSGPTTADNYVAIIPYVDGNEYFYTKLDDEGKGRLYSSTGEYLLLDLYTYNYDVGDLWLPQYKIIKHVTDNTSVSYFNSMNTNLYLAYTASNFTIKNEIGEVVLSNKEASIPNNEELISNCNFKVDFKFAPNSNDFPSDNVGSRWSWFGRLLVQHTMSNWDSDYKVKVNLSVLNKTQPNGLYYDLYNSNGDEIQKKKHIQEGILTKDINDGDFFLFFTDNLQDTFKLEYQIYNKSEELLISKIYTFKFTKSGLTAINSTGVILSEQIQNNSGEDIKSEENSFNTNGYDNTSVENDYYDVSNLDSLASSASDTINLAQKCFAILPGFIWVMVGVFLSVCIALRVLGR